MTSTNAQCADALSELERRIERDNEQLLRQIEACEGAERRHLLAIHSGLAAAGQMLARQHKQGSHSGDYERAWNRYGTALAAAAANESDPAVAAGLGIALGDLLGCRAVLAAV